MSEQMRPTTVPESVADAAHYIDAIGVPAIARTDTTTLVRTGRTVATSLTTGSVSLRYAPRTPTASRRTDPTS